MSHSSKSKKALVKRIKVSSHGKLLKRASHQSHFNAKESGNATRSKRGSMLAPHSLINDAKALLPNF